MKILLICNKSPWPPKEGGPLGLDFMIRGLIHTGHQVKVLAASTDKYPVDISSVPEEYRKAANLILLPLHLRFSFTKAFSSLLTGKPYTITRFHSTGFEEKITELLSHETFDLVQLEYLHMAVYLPLIRKLHKGSITLREHNIEYKIWERLGINTRNPFKKLLYRYLANSTRHFELDIIRKTDGIIAVSSVDEAILKRHTSQPVISIPFGVFPEKYDLEKETEYKPFSLAMIGSLDWRPNLESVQWVIRNVLPGLEKSNPSIHLYIAGRNTPRWLTTLRKPNLSVVGETEDARQFMHSHSVLLVPLFSGSGIRIKIIEALSLGMPVISTTIGAEGINYTNGKDLLIADTPEEFIRAITELCANPSKMKELRENGRTLIMKEHNTPLLMKRLNDFYSSLLNSPVH